MTKVNEWTELFRSFIPSKYILNENSGQHYRIMQGKMQWIQRNFNALREKDESYTPIVGGFISPNIEDIQKLTKDQLIDVRCEAWRAVNRRFDLQNLSKTFKVPIDLLTKLGYLEDDSWEYIKHIEFAGGGRSSWLRSYDSRSVNYDDKPKYISNNYQVMDDGLPKDMTPDWWKEFSNNYGDIFVRILIKPAGEKEII